LVGSVPVFGEVGLFCFSTSEGRGNAADGEGLEWSAPFDDHRLGVVSTFGSVLLKGIGTSVDVAHREPAGGGDRSFLDVTVMDGKGEGGELAHAMRCVGAVARHVGPAVTEPGAGLREMPAGVPALEAHAIE